MTVFQTTSLIPHQFNAYLDVYERDGWPVAQETLGECCGAYVVEVGPQQRLVQSGAIATIGTGWIAVIGSPIIRGGGRSGPAQQR